MQKKGYRRVMRQMDRAATPSKIVLRAFGARLAGTVKLDSALPKKPPFVDEQKANIVDSNW